MPDVPKKIAKFSFFKGGDDVLEGKLVPVVSVQHLFARREWSMSCARNP